MPLEFIFFPSRFGLGIENPYPIDRVQDIYQSVPFITYECDQPLALFQPPLLNSFAYRAALTPERTGSDT